MPFTEEDLDTMLEATGEPVAVLLRGVTVKTIQGKLRKNFESLQAFESSTGILHPTLTVKTSDLADVTNEHTFLAGGVEYKKDTKPEEQPSGLTVVHLGIKK